jgi:hypothetical protein
MQGGVVQSIGWALTEEYFYDDQGRLRNPSLLDYRMPTALDAPNIECILVEESAADGPYGVRGTGEVPIVPGAAAIANAVYDAIGARVTRLPILGNRVLGAIATNGSNGKARAAAPSLLTERPVVADARRSVLNAQNRKPAGGVAKLATESEDYCAEDDVAEQPAGADGANATRSGPAGKVKLATESEDYCAEDDVAEK